MGDHTEFDVPWLAGMYLYRDPAPLGGTGFVRTRHIGNKKEGCFMCGKKYNPTRHHIKKGPEPLAVFLCRKHHDIIHGTGLHRFRTYDIRMVLSIADRYNLFKESEANMIMKRLIIELDAREYDINTETWFGRVAWKTE